MKKITLVLFLFFAACAPMQAPAVPTQVINQYPTLLPTPTLAVLTREINEEEKEEAFNFFYELKIQMATGEYEHFTEEIRYPITVQVDGFPKTFIFAAELEASFEKIFTEEIIQKFIAIDESELTFTPDGVKVANGIIWFDLICQDPNCNTAEFMITQINH